MNAENMKHNIVKIVLGPAVNVQKHARPMPLNKNY
jgi:hypothetical protein